ncbi:MAG: hypothetical protein RSD39_05615 [Oscillospiraceae bacterium]
MKRFVEFEKMSKRQKREENNRRRSTWGALNPATLRAENKKTYNRKRTDARHSEVSSGGSSFFMPFFFGIVGGSILRKQG